MSDQFDRELETRLDGTTRLESDDVFDCATHAAEGLSAENIVLGEREQDEKVLIFSLQPKFRLHGKKMMGAVVVSIESTCSSPERSTRVAAYLELDQVSVRRRTFSFSPQVVGFQLYARFLDAFKRSLESSDPTSDVQVSQSLERAEQLIAAEKS